MTLFTNTDNHFIAQRRGSRPIILDTIDPARAALALVAAGHSQTVAEAIARGALISRADAAALARQMHLIAPVETVAARTAGLLQ